MVKMTKDGITKYIPDNEVQKYEDWGFKKQTHKPEPMVIEKDTKTKEK